MFKKIIFSMFLVVCIFGKLSANQSSGVFVGANFGVPVTVPEYFGSISKMKSDLPTTGVGYSISINVGYKQLLSQNMGLKYYLDYNFNESFGKSSGGTLFSKVDAKIAQQLITANVDYFYNPTDLFGMYIGIGLGYQGFRPIYTTTLKATSITNTIGSGLQGGFALPLNLGFTFNVSASHQIILGAKIPVASYNYKESFSTIKLSSYIVHLGYNYTF